MVALGAWMAFRLVNLPAFADFLVSVEAEMNKVSWPSRGELYRSSLVVLVMIGLLAVVLYAFDVIWGVAFKWLGIL
jgi:preprotein translocase subunit SecE